MGLLGSASRRMDTMNQNHEDAGGFGELPPGAQIVDARPIVAMIREAIKEHRELCPIESEQIPERLRATETRLASLIGLIVGSSILGGSLAAALAKLL